MSGPDCFICRVATEVLSTSNKYKYYCPRCDIRYAEENGILTNVVEVTEREKILLLAKQYVSQDRNVDYDTPEKNFEMIAELWNAYLANRGTHPLHPYDVAVLMLLVKVARISTSPQKQDHWIDIAGYAACGAECVVEKPNA